MTLDIWRVQMGKSLKQKQILVDSLTNLWQWKLSESRAAESIPVSVIVI